MASPSTPNPFNRSSSNAAESTPPEAEPVETPKRPTKKLRTQKAGDLEATTDSEGIRRRLKQEEQKRARNASRREQRALDKALTRGETNEVDLQYDELDSDASKLTRESYEFVGRLKGNQFATTTDVFKVETARLRPLNVVGICRELPAVLANPPSYEITLVEDATALANALSRPYKMIMCTKDSNLVSTHGWTIEQQVQILRKGTGDAYQPARAPGVEGATTHPVDANVLLRAFINKDDMEPEDRGLNLLDIANTSGKRFWPDAILEASLIHRIHRATAGASWSRDGYQAPIVDEWLIITKQNSVSSLHVDSAGCHTCIVGLVGRKVWETPNGDTRRLWPKFQYDGPFGTNYAKGIGATPIDPGTCLIMSPGTIHAVVTPADDDDVDAMIAGCFFYTAASFAMSIECVRRGLDGTLWSNDDVKAKQWAQLQTCVANLDVEGIFSDVEREDVYGAVGDLLRQEGAVELSKDGDHERVLKEQKKLKGGKKASAEAVMAHAQDMFIWECVEWWCKASEVQ